MGKLIHSALNLKVIASLALLVIVSAGADQQDRLQELGQRLVRRNFLRFGKRSNISPDATFPMKKDEPPAAQQQAGPGEQYELMLMAGKHPHKSSTRSFLRFGKRADNFLRFGKSLEQPGDWEQRLVALLNRLDKDDDEDIRNYAKKSNDFLRFG